MSKTENYSCITTKNKLISLNQWLQEEQKAAILEVEKMEECKRFLEFTTTFKSKNDCNCSQFNNFLGLRDPSCPSPEELSKYSYSELGIIKTELKEKLNYFQKLQKIQELEESKSKTIELLCDYYTYTSDLNSNVLELATFVLKPFNNWYTWVDSILDIQGYGQILYLYFISHVLVVGLTLLSVLIGVVYLTNNYKLKSTEQSSFKQLSRRSK